MPEQPEEPDSEQSQESEHGEQSPADDGSEACAVSVCLISDMQIRGCSCAMNQCVCSFLTCRHLPRFAMGQTTTQNGFSVMAATVGSI